jgi:putative oxidoreductase
MSIFEPSPRAAHYVLGIVRIVCAAVFISYGTMKLFGYPPSPVPMPPMTPFSQLWIAGVLEVYGGLAILFGLLTRPIAFVLAGEMAAAYFIGHFAISPFPAVNNGSPAVLYCFLFLYLTFAGSGAWSIDNLIAFRRTK